MEQITLDMIPNSHTPIAHISQYDSGRHIRFNLQNITLTGSETVTLKIRKPDGELVSKTIENHTSYVEYVSETADCDVSGKSNCEIVISKDDVVIGSKNFIMEVEADAYDGAGVITKTASGAIATFETNLADVLQSLKCDITASGGNGSPDSPIPIVGHSELNLTRCGKNLFDNSNFPSGYGAIVATYNPDETVKLNGTASGNEYFSIPIDLPNSNYVLSVGNTSANANVHVSFVNHNSGFYGDNDLSTTSKVVNISGDISAIVFYVISGTTLTDFTIKPMLELDSTATAYEPYNGDTFTVAFGQTVYGGVYDGKRLTITWSAVDLGTFDYRRNTSNIGGRYRFTAQTQLSNAKAPATNNTPPNALTDRYQPYGRDWAWAYDIDDIFAFDNGYVNIYDSAFNGSTPEAFKTAMSGIILAYELATPIVIDVPSISVNAENGTNNVFSDTGDTEVKYLYKA